MSITSRTDRPYEALRSKDLGHATREDRMVRAADALWDALHPTGVSWIGFYTGDGSQQMLLAARRDKPACSPIGLHGACGRSFLSNRSLVVTDVARLGPDYIACDPKDRSEVVVPLLDEAGAPWGVLDADSHDINAFSESDARSLFDVLHAWGLTWGSPPPVDLV